MINSEDFIKRLEVILDYYSLNASSFADKIGVQRSSLSHLLSGRNKPSLDFILKILDVFPEVDLYWILNGKGTFPKSDLIKENNFIPPTPILDIEIATTKLDKQNDLFSEKNEQLQFNTNESLTKTVSTVNNLSPLENNTEIDRIVIFYRNGTFKTYAPE